MKPTETHHFSPNTQIPSQTRPFGKALRHPFPSSVSRPSDWAGYGASPSFRTRKPCDTARGFGFTDQSPLCFASLGSLENLGERQVWNKGPPGWCLFRIYRGWKTTQWYGDYFINHFKNPYQTSSMLESKMVFFVATHFWSRDQTWCYILW